MKTQKTVCVIFSALFVLFLFTFGIWVNVKKPNAVSKSERRELAKMPSLTISNVRDGSFFTDYEAYMLDQFPAREAFRTVKSTTQFYLFRQKDNHGIFIADGSAAQITYPLTDKSVSVYIKRLNALHKSYFKDADVHVYQTIIPDKAMVLGGSAGCPMIDYSSLFERVKNETDIPFTDISETLSKDSYYKTDTHWSMDKIIETANTLLRSMGAEEKHNYSVRNTLSPFYGVYYGQSALPLSPDKIITLGSEEIDSAKVLRANKRTGELEDGKVYYDEYIGADDPYDVFLGGASTITVIDNTKVSSGKTLYLISDSFGRSLAPLLLSDYDRVVVLDIRYMRMSMMLDKIPLEKGSDVLIAYSISAIDVSSNLQVN